MTAEGRTMLRRPVGWVLVLALGISTSALGVEDPLPGAPAQPPEPGPAVRRVPRLVGLLAADARQRIRLAEFRESEGVFYIAPQNWRDEIDPAAVSMQTPRPGTAVPPGTSVGVWRFVRAAPGQKTLKTPALRGKRWSEARTLIAGAGLRPAEGPAIRDLRDDDLVADQYPRPDQPVYERTSVLVSRIPEEDAP
jgi:beta-lactam-binding protein with PASTA domain